MFYRGVTFFHIFYFLCVCVCVFFFFLLGFYLIFQVFVVPLLLFLFPSLYCAVKLFFSCIFPFSFPFYLLSFSLSLPGKRCGVLNLPGNCPAQQPLKITFPGSFSRFRESLGRPEPLYVGSNTPFRLSLTARVRV